MKTELQRQREALAVAIAEFRSLGLDYAHFTDSVEEKIAAILNPPPEFEPVEVVKWALLRSSGFTDHFEDEYAAIRCRDNHHAGCPIVKLTGTYHRPKPPKVERSAIITLHSAGGTCGTWSSDIPMPDGDGTFTWQEGSHE